MHLYKYCLVTELYMKYKATVFVVCLIDITMYILLLYIYCYLTSHNLDSFNIACVAVSHKCAMLCFHIKK